MAEIGRQSGPFRLQRRVDDVSVAAVVRLVDIPPLKACRKLMSTGGVNNGHFYHYAVYVNSTFSVVFEPWRARGRSEPGPRGNQQVPRVRPARGRPHGS